MLTYNNAFVPGGTWLQPLTILTPRFFKITAEIRLLTFTCERCVTVSGVRAMAAADRVDGRRDLGPVEAALAADGQKQVLVLYSTRRDAQIAVVGDRELPRILEQGLPETTWTTTPNTSTGRGFPTRSTRRPSAISCG